MGRGTIDLDGLNGTPENTLSTIEKAHAFNLDPLKYGTIVEIGAGQEVARWFFPRRRRRRFDRQDHVGLRHELQRRDLRQGLGPALRLAAAAGADARAGIRPGRCAGRGPPPGGLALLRLRRHRRGAGLQDQGRVPRLAGGPLPDGPDGGARRHHPARADARRHQRRAAGGAGHSRRQPHPRRLHLRRHPEEAGAPADGQPQARARRDRPGRVPRPDPGCRRQPADGARTGQGEPDHGGDVRPLVPARDRRRCPSTNKAWLAMRGRFRRAMPLDMDRVVDAGTRFLEQDGVTDGQVLRLAEITMAKPARTPRGRHGRLPGPHHQPDGQRLPRGDLAVPPLLRPSASTWRTTAAARSA